MTGSLVPGSPDYSGPVWDGTFPTTGPAASPAARTAHRRPWMPASQDDVDGPRRRRLADRDVQLHVTHAPCPSCGQTARLSGGDGCRCHSSGADLAARCEALAERAYAQGR